jgi:CRISPR-associated endoribonuclease Cas6
MRLLIKLRCIESCRYELQYHYHLQGVIYSLLKGSKYSKEGYKFFCFSNIFPIAKNLEKNNLYTLVVSSPDHEFITYLSELKSLIDSSIKIGIMKFQIDFVNKFILNLPNKDSFTLITGTHIIVRIPREIYTVYGVRPSRDYSYIYWKQGYPITLLISQLENNLKKKSIEFSKLSNSYGLLKTSTYDLYS